LKNERTREILALGTLGVSAFLAAAMVSYHEDLPPAREPGVQNVCGPIGYAAARFLFHHLGLSAYLIVIALALEALRLWRGARYRSLLEKLPALLLFAVALSATLSKLCKGWTRSIPDPGGDVGIVVTSLIFEHSGLGPMGASLLLAFFLLTTFVLFSDLLVSSVVQSGLHWLLVRAGVPVDRRRAPAAGGRRPRAGPKTVGGQESGHDPDEEELDDPFDAEHEAGAGLDDSVEDADDADPVEENSGAAGARLPAALQRKERERSLARLIARLRETPDSESREDGRQPLLTAPRPAAPSASVDPYEFPSLQLLVKPSPISGSDLEQFTVAHARKLTQVLQSFKLEANVVGVQRGPSITMLEVELAPGTKLGRLRSLEDDLAMNLAARSVRIVAPIPGKSTAGIEIPNEVMETVRLSELITSPAFTRRQDKLGIPIFLGKDSAGYPRIEDLAQMPHLLVAGSTGAGKSVCLNTMIMSILYTRTPDQVQLILIDPKMVELSSFQNVPHLMCPVVTDMKRAAAILEWAVEKMDSRYQLMHEVGVRNIYAYNKLGADKIREKLGDNHSEDTETALPLIVIVIDELADLMLVSAKDVETSITRLAQKSRAVGIHVILATQRPSTNVITGLIKANLPTRIAFRVASKVDSRVILDANGADKLLGAGDMLFLPPRSAELVRVQGAFVEDQEIRNTVEFLASRGQPRYSRELMQRRSKPAQDPFEIDDLFEDATRYVVETQRGSASLLQRRFAIGYTRASRLIDLMAGEAILGDYKGSQAREVLMPPEDLQAWIVQRKRSDSMDHEEEMEETA